MRRSTTALRTGVRSAAALALALAISTTSARADGLDDGLERRRGPVITPPSQRGAVDAQSPYEVGDVVPIGLPGRTGGRDRVPPIWEPAQGEPHTALGPWARFCAWVRVALD